MSVLLVAGGCPGLAIMAQHRAIADIVVVLGKSREIATHRGAAIQCVALGPAPGVGSAARADHIGVNKRSRESVGRHRDQDVQQDRVATWRPCQLRISVNYAQTQLTAGEPSSRRSGLPRLTT